MATVVRFRKSASDLFGTLHDRWTHRLHRRRGQGKISPNRTNSVSETKYYAKCGFKDTFCIYLIYLRLNGFCLLFGHGISMSEVQTTTALFIHSFTLFCYSL